MDRPKPKYDTFCSGGPCFFARVLYWLMCFCLLLGRASAQERQRPASQATDAGNTEKGGEGSDRPWEIKTQYDEFKNVTIVSLQGMELPRAVTSFGLTHPMSVTAHYFCLRKTSTCKPDYVGLIFHADTTDWLYQSVHRSIMFMVDGQRISVPSAGWDGSVIGAKSLLEQMDTDIPTAQFLRIIQGHSVRGQIAFTTFNFTDENLEALRDLMSRVAPSLKPPKSSRPPSLSVQATPDKNSLDTLSRVHSNDPTFVNDPSIEYHVEPIYPEVAKIAHISGTVVLQLVIGKDGSVEAAEYVSGPSLLLKAAIDAARQWRYQPKVVDGQPVKMQTVASIVFPSAH